MFDDDEYILKANYVFQIISKSFPKTNVILTVANIYLNTANDALKIESALLKDFY